MDARARLSSSRLELVAPAASNWVVLRSFRVADESDHAARSFGRRADRDGGDGRCPGALGKPRCGAGLYASISSREHPAHNLGIGHRLHPRRLSIRRFGRLTGLTRDQARCLRWVKLRRTSCEHMSSGLPLKADMARCDWHLAKVPYAAIDQPYSITSSARPSSVAIRDSYGLTA
jgi:hypothetical protein